MDARSERECADSPRSVGRIEVCKAIKAIYEDTSAEFSYCSHCVTSAVMVDAASRASCD
jgi:hypothetical protein